MNSVSRLLGQKSVMSDDMTSILGGGGLPSGQEDTALPAASSLISDLVPESDPVAGAESDTDSGVLADTVGFDTAGDGPESGESLPAPASLDQGAGATLDVNMDFETYTGDAPAGVQSVVAWSAGFLQAATATGAAETAVQMPAAGAAASDAMTTGTAEGMGAHGAGHGAMIPPPPAGASQAVIDAYVTAVMAQPEAEAHGAEPGKATEHMAAMELTPRDQATHVAVSDGDWFDTATWYNGEIPDAGAKVLIPEGIHVQYGDVSDTRLFTLRVDGTLDFGTDVDSRMVFDTMVVSSTGTLVIGTETDPVDPDVSVELIVANNGPIDTAWDPMLLSRGIVSHGTASIHGAVKDSHEKVANDPMAGNKALVFDTLPEGWKVGDKIVVAGTHYDGYKWDTDLGATRLYENEDEVRTIKAIKDNKIILNKALDFDHDTPRDDLKTSVANMSRNVVIETENGKHAEVYERGHVMFMHSDSVDVRYAEFLELGRTDKSVPSFDISDFAQTQFDSNVQGRYSLHLHRTGTDNHDEPAMVVGNAVWGSPGWGYVHHDSNAILDNNASFDTFGAGFVAETGNETGIWNDNIAIHATGVDWGAAKTTSILSEDAFDTGRGGDGFWFQGRLVASTNNIAASVNHGFTYFHRDGDNRMLTFDADAFEYPDIFYDRDGIAPNKAPILHFQGNEVFAAHFGLEVVKANGIQEHDVWSHIDDFTAWSVQNGVFLEYTTHYLLTNIDVVGKDPTKFSLADIGIEIGKGTSDIVIVDSTIDGFTTGVWFGNDGPAAAHIPTELTNYFVIDTSITNTDTDYPNYNPTYNVITTRDALAGKTPDLKLDPLLYATKSLGITGTKVDGVGSIDFPSGTDRIILDQADVVRLLDEKGYWTTSAGESYFLLDVYFSDRLTGAVYFETHSVQIGEAVVAKLGQPWWDYANVSLNGVQDIVTANGVTMAGGTLLDTAIKAITPMSEGPNLAPVMFVNDVTLGLADGGRMAKLKNLLAVFDSDGDKPVWYELLDTERRNNFSHREDGVIDAEIPYRVSADELDMIRVRNNGDAGDTTIHVRAFDGTDVSDWVALTVTTLSADDWAASGGAGGRGKTNFAPQVSLEDVTVGKTQGARRADLQNLLEVFDPDGDEPVWYELLDTKGRNNFFHKEDGVIDAETPYRVSADELDMIRVRNNVNVGDTTVHVRAFDGTDVSDWAALTVTTLSADDWLSI